MLFHAHLDRVQKLFADQFSCNSDGCLYRRGQKGPPIRVSEAERDKFVTMFKRRIRNAIWSVLLATVGLIFLLVWLVPDNDGAMAQTATWAGIVAVLVPFLGVYYWAWNAPSRDLERRTPEGAALTKEEARALALSKITYGQLALAALMGVGLILTMSTRADIFHNWEAVWLVSGAGLVMLAGVQAIRKWRFSQRLSERPRMER